jgi:hypothetical protein
MATDYHFSAGNHPAVREIAGEYSVPRFTAT